MLNPSGLGIAMAVALRVIMLAFITANGRYGICRLWMMVVWLGRGWRCAMLVLAGMVLFSAVRADIDFLYDFLSDTSRGAFVVWNAY